MRKRILVIMLGLLSYFGICNAHGGGGGGGANISSGTTCSSIITITPETLPRCSWSAGIQMRFIDFDTWSTEKLLREAEKHPDTDIETEDYAYEASLFYCYGICDNLMLTLSLPYVSTTEIRHAEPDEENPEEFEVHTEGDSNGLGDLGLVLTWKFYQNACFNTSAALLFGVTMPTGRTDVKNIHGERFAGDHQPGTGSYNPLVGLAVSKTWGQSAFYSDVFYLNRTKGAHHTHLGDIFNYNFALVHQFKLCPKKARCSHQREFCFREAQEHHHDDSDENHHDDSNEHHHDEPHEQHFSESHENKEESPIALDIMLELSGTVEGKDHLDGGVNVNSGGHSLYLFPGVRILSGSRGLGCAYLSLGWPVYQDLNGAQTKSRMQVFFGVVLDF